MFTMVARLYGQACGYLLIIDADGVMAVGYPVREKSLADGVWRLTGSCHIRVHASGLY
jgi:hypothetical protein